jgi:three-Cys-motif partner protein
MGKESEFFKGKRPWSLIKDRILENYLTPYITKVAKLNKRIIFVDAFAGPGRFDDGSTGSPLLICETAEKIAPNKYFAIFLNSDKDSYQKLNFNVKKYTDKGSAKSVYGQAEDLLSILKNIIGDSTLLLYLDPFGLKGCYFHLLEPYLGRDKKFSTEIIINMSMPTLHRYATRKAVQSGQTTSQTQSLNRELSKILGSEDWKEIMWSDIPAKEKEEKVIEQYVNRLKNELPFPGYCSVREKISTRTKYYVIFCSRHPDALRLMNDIMHNAYFGIMSEVSFKDTLFKDQALDLIKPSRNLKEEIINTVNKYPGIKRKDCWLEIIKNHFMVWPKSEFIEMVDQLRKEEELKFQSRTKRLNEDAQLYPKHYNYNLNPTPIRMKIHWDYFQNLDDQPELLLKKINDGSIITRFDKTPTPKESHDVVCPHFIELKWAYGCPFDCSWCYLKGTFRF